jgi:hypothetical protein
MATSILTVKGQKQDLSDALVLIEPGDTPIFSLCKKGQEPANVLYQWPVDAYDSANTDGVLANASVSTFSDKHANRELLSGRVQKIRRAFQVDDFVENVADLAGVGKRQAFNKAAAKSLVELKIDIESILGSDNDSVVASGSQTSGGVANKTRGLGSWISNSAQADTATAVPAAFRTPSASINTTVPTSLTEANVIDLLESMFTERRQRRNYDLVCGTALKKAFSGFIRTQSASTNVMSSVRTFTQDAESKKIVSVIDIYESDFGTLALHPSVYLGGDDATSKAARGYVLDMDMVEIRFNRKPQMQKLPVDGAGPRGYVDAILGVACLNPRVLGKFAYDTP